MTANSPNNTVPDRLLCFNGCKSSLFAGHIIMDLYRKYKWAHQGSLARGSDPNEVNSISPFRNLKEGQSNTTKRLTPARPWFALRCGLQYHHLPLLSYPTLPSTLYRIHGICMSGRSDLSLSPHLCLLLGAGTVHC